MEEILEIVNTFEVQTMIRLLLCVLLAGFIGMEREHLKKPAGARTHMLLCISGCLVMLTGEYVSIGSEMADMTRLPAQLLSGIGFIGAGTILKDGSNIKGLTTAASLLCTTCIGLAVGAGFYLGGIIGTIVLYIILSHSLLNALVVSLIFLSVIFLPSAREPSTVHWVVQYTAPEWVLSRSINFCSSLMDFILFLNLSGM